MNKGINFVRTIFTSGAMVLFATLLMGSGAAQAETQAWTGCVTPGGTIVHLARGDTPRKTCPNKMRLIHLRDEAAMQNTTTNYNQAAICEAFHKLNLGNDELEKLGCPSTPTLTRPGTVHGPVNGSDLVNNDFDVCGIIKVEASSRPPWYQYVIPGGFVASTTIQSYLVQEPNTACEQLCIDDNKCIAAWYFHENNTDEFATCRVFHYSDSNIADWNHLCGTDQGFSNTGLPSGCADLINTPDQSWYVRLPEGQNLDTCPGADPIP